jgi:hypothetical protein
MSTTLRSPKTNLKRLEILLVLALLLASVTSAQAVLFRVGPNDVPSPPGNGFPLWYQDTQGLALDLCLPRNQAQLDAGICLILPPDQDPAGLNLPIVFPSNFPDEAFWWNATAVMDLTATSRAVLVLAVEAAFGGGPVAVGDQVTFGRLRIIVDAPVDGNYTVTTPFGVKVFPDVQAGRRAITFTSDIGIGAPGDFSGALRSEVGPFLQAAAAPGGPALAPITVAGDTSGDQFLSDPALPVSVTGSPIDDPDDAAIPPQKANFFRICVDAVGGLDGAGTACKTETGFTLDRATYARSAAGAHVDVFASASPGPGAATPRLFFGDAGGTNLMPSTLMNGPTNLGQFYGQSIPTAADALPASVIVTNTADNPPSSIVQSLVDEVTITRAIYDPGPGTLTVTATSSDKGLATVPPASLIVPPQLFAIGLPGSAGSETLIPTGNPADPAEQQIVYTIPAPRPPGGPVPPFAVNVISSAGGRDAETSSTLAGGVFAAGGPIAVEDSVSIDAGTVPSVAINILQNDFGFSQTTVRIVSQGQNGTAVADPATGVVTYTFINNTLIGDDVFTYTVKNAAGLESNIASVLVTTTTPAGGPIPIAVNDGPFNVQVNAQLVIAAATLIANDSGNGGTLDPASIQIVAATGGTAVFAAGAVTFTAGPLAGSFNFTYTVANTAADGSQRSAPATVAITVLPANAAIVINTAEFRTGTRRWDVTGTSTVNGSTVTVRLVRTGAVVGTAPVVAGAWSFRVLNSTVIAVNGDQVNATSNAGGNANLLVRVRQ